MHHYAIQTFILMLITLIHDCATRAIITMAAAGLFPTFSPWNGYDLVVQKWAFSVCLIWAMWSNQNIIRVQVSVKIMFMIYQTLIKIKMFFLQIVSGEIPAHMSPFLPHKPIETIGTLRSLPWMLECSMKSVIKRYDPNKLSSPKSYLSFLWSCLFETEAKIS